jgi:N,N'-diacetyl-8-epilegionaminate cytidylyltransferase
MKKNCIGFIFARGGSKGVPRKNIKLLNGKPLIAYAIECAINSKYIDRVIVSTEDEEIAQISRNYGAEVPFIRPDELATDKSSEMLSWRHAINTLVERDEFDIKNDIFVSIPCTAPLRASEDIDNCIRALMECRYADLSITVKDAERHPSFNMVKINDKGFCSLLMPLNYFKNRIVRRQDAPKVYDITTVCYAGKPLYILKMKTLLEGKVTASIVPKERALDIDTVLDFKFAEFLIREKNASR